MSESNIDQAIERLLQMMLRYPTSPSGSTAQDLQKLAVAYGILMDKKLLLERGSS